MTDHGGCPSSFAVLLSTGAFLPLELIPPGRGIAAEPLFVDSAAATGLAFTHTNGASGRLYIPELMGSGGALIDYDNDGDLDVFLVQGGPLESGGGPPGRPQATSRLFRNDLSKAGAAPRTLRFTDVTAAAGVGSSVYGMGAAVGDYDNDGDFDLFVTSFGPDTLYRNNGNGTFTDVTAEAGVSDPLWSASATFVDYDRDGDLDLFVANYLDFTIAGNKSCADSVGARDYCGPRAYRPVPDRLYRNEGNGRFADVTESAGISKADGAGLGVSAGDYNGDGWLDLYVANDATPNQLWINRRDGTFADEGLLSGAALNAAGNPEGSMGIASGDFDADGDEDLFVTNLVGETFVLYRNDGRGNFEDARVEVGLSAPTAAFTGFGTDWFDYDNDGWLDLFVANGAVNTIEAQRGQPSPFRMRNQLFRNTGRALRGDERGGRAGARAHRRQPRRGLRRHRQRRRHRRGRHHQRRARQALDQPGSFGRRQSLAAGRHGSAPGQPLRVRRAGRRRTRGAAHALAPCEDRRQLSLRKRSPRAFRPGLVRRAPGDRRPVARRAARTVDRRRGGSADHAAPRHRPLTRT